VRVKGILIVGEEDERGCWLITRTSPDDRTQYDVTLTKHKL